MRLALKYKIGAFVSLLILLIMGTVGYVFWVGQEETLRESMRRRAFRIATITGSLSVLKGQGVEQPWVLARKFIYNVPQLDDNILYIVLLDREGNLQGSALNEGLARDLLGPDILTTRRAAFLESLRARVAQRALGLTVSSPGPVFLDRAGPMLKFEVVLKPEEALAGAVGIGFSLRALEAEVRTSRLKAISLTLGFFLFGALCTALLAASVTRPLEVLKRAMDRVRAGDLSQEVHLRSRDEIGALATTFNLMTEGLRDRERIKDTFKRYVSEQVAEKILAERGSIELRGERRVATVLFQDIRGFTTVSEKLPPEEVVSMLNEYFGRMVDVIFKYEGTLDKFIGDAIMAVFGAPIDHGDEAHRAVQCAIEMQQELARLDEARSARGQQPIYAGCGIATGDLVQGSIGHVRRMEYTVIGDTVNVASRIQGKTGRGQILIDERTYRQVKEEVRVKAWEPILVKGKTIPVQVYEVLHEA